MSSLSPAASSGFLSALSTRQWWLGVALAGAIAGCGLWLAGLPSMRALGFSSLTFAIVIGMVLGNTLFPAIAPHSAAGVDFCKTRLLRAGIILFGFRLTFQEAASIGVAGIVLDAVIILSVYGLAMTAGRRLFGLDRQTCMLVGAGSAICGAAAVMAMETVTRAQAHKVSVAVATVVVFGTIGMFLYPLLYPILGMSEHAFGIFIGSTVHEVAQVVAAGNAVGPVAANTAVVEKMLRVMMLAPFLILVSWWEQRRASREGGNQDAGKARPSIPWFAVGFVAAVGLNSLGIIAPEVASMLVQLSTILLAMAMAALGLRTHVSAIRQAGAAPLALAGVLFLFLLIGGFGLNLLAARLG
ncbi:YeiH family putative sulfate export transporter [Alcaligenaceae bacterium]|nr:YeiH family putative sulfate export transporter [Alcaligenaceae bacterium]